MGRIRRLEIDLLAFRGSETPGKKSVRSPSEDCVISHRLKLDSLPPNFGKHVMERQESKKGKTRKSSHEAINFVVSLWRKLYFTNIVSDES